MNLTGTAVDSVVIDGRTVMKHREIPGVDVAAMRPRALEWFDRYTHAYTAWDYRRRSPAELFPRSFRTVGALADPPARCRAWRAVRKSLESGIDLESRQGQRMAALPSATAIGPVRGGMPSHAARVTIASALKGASSPLVVIGCSIVGR